MTNVPIYYYFLGHHSVSNSSLPLCIWSISMGFKRDSVIILKTCFYISMHYSRSYNKSTIKKNPKHNSTKACGSISASKKKAPSNTHSQSCRNPSWCSDCLDTAGTKQWLGGENGMRVKVLKISSQGNSEML